MISAPIWVFDLLTHPIIIISSNIMLSSTSPRLQVGPVMSVSSSPNATIMIIVLFTEARDTAAVNTKCIATVTARTSRLCALMAYAIIYQIFCCKCVLWFGRCGVRSVPMFPGPYVPRTYNMLHLPVVFPGPCVPRYSI